MRSAMCNKVWKVWEGWQSVHWKSSRMCLRFWSAPNTRMWSILKTNMCFLCFARHCSSPIVLNRVVAAFTLSVFTRQSLSSFFLTCVTVFDIATMSETTSAASALEMIILCNYTQRFVNRSFNCIPKQDGCLCTNHTFNCILKRDRNWDHTPPTENTLCKISTLVLRHLAINTTMSNCFLQPWLLS